MKFLFAKNLCYEDSKILLEYYMVLYIIVVLSFLLKLIRNHLLFESITFHFMFHMYKTICSFIMPNQSKSLTPVLVEFVGVLW